MRLDRLHLWRFLLPILSLMWQPASSWAAPDSNSVQAVIDSLIVRMRTSGGSASALDSLLILSDSVENLAALYFGKNDTAIAIALAFKGTALIWNGSDAAAESCLTVAIRIWRTSRGQDCPQQASAMRILGDLYHFQHRDVESEKTYFSAIDILNNAPPHEGSWTTRWMLALLHNNLGNLYERQARFKSAIEHFTQALQLWTQELGANSREANVVRLNLGSVALDQSDYVAAERHLRLALSCFEGSAPGMISTNSFVDCTRLTLAMVCIHTGHLDDARSLFSTALAGYIKTYGELTRGTLPALEVGVSVQSALGDWAAATRLAEQEVEVVKHTDARNAADMSNYLMDLALCRYQLREYRKSSEAWDEANALRQAFVAGAFSYASETAKLLYLREFPLVSSVLMSTAVESGNPGLLRSAFQALLLAKASVLDALSEERRTAWCSTAPDMALLIERYTDACNAIAELAVARSGSAALTPKSETTPLYKQKDSLELELSRRCSEFGNNLRTDIITTAALAKAVPKGSVLWEFVRYAPYKSGPPDSSVPPRYLAFTLDKAGQLNATDLGEAAIIDSLVNLVHSKMQAGVDVFAGADEWQLEKDLASVSSKLAALVYAPLVKTANASNHIFISPDGQLSLLPFEILSLPNGHYAIEDYEFSYLSSGRDLLQFPRDLAGQASGALVISSPDYESAGHPIYAQANIGGLDAGQLRGPSDRTECLSVPYSPLRSSAIEGQAVANLLRTRQNEPVVILSGAAASEDSLKHWSSVPRILHLATHGYFCSKAGYCDVSQMTESPLLYSGLLLAGCNRSIRGQDSSASRQQDGILTALEVSGLNLQGTDLVVLSACQTGLGEVASGEGVYGLRRAFQLAGARSVVMSMFSVPDKTATDLMTSFYTNWLSGRSKSESMRNAQLSALRERRLQRGAAHPLFWGGFIVTGSP